MTTIHKTGRVGLPAARAPVTPVGSTRPLPDVPPGAPPRQLLGARVRAAFRNRRHPPRDEPERGEPTDPAWQARAARSRGDWSSHPAGATARRLAEPAHAGTPSSVRRRPIIHFG